MLHLVGQNGIQVIPPDANRLEVSVLGVHPDPENEDSENIPLVRDENPVVSIYEDTDFYSYASQDHPFFRTGSRPLSRLILVSSHENTVVEVK